MVSKESYAEMLYNRILKNIAYPALGKDVTFMNDLNSFGKLMLGKKFVGVFPSDKIPTLTKTSPYAIINLDKTGESGSHWISIVKSGDKTYVYDSFARANFTIIPSLSNSNNGEIVDSDLSDREQKIIQNDCGARAISFILLSDTFGIELAKLV